MYKVCVIIMAAGEGKRMKSETSKLLHKVCFKPMIDYVVDAAVAVSQSKPLVIVGHKKEQVMSHLGDRVCYSHQNEQKGTGHALMQATEYIKEQNPKCVVVLNGDIPLISCNTIKQAVETHKNGKFGVTVIGAMLDCPHGYGRIIRDDQRNLLKIVEQKDATEQEQAICEINSGIYCFDSRLLLYALEKLTNNNEAKEYYLTDTIEIIRSKGYSAGVFTAADKNEIMGSNNRAELSVAEGIMRNRINHLLMENGVTIIDPNNTYIGANVVIGADTVIYPGCIIEGKTIIGSNCKIGPNACIDNCEISDHVSFSNSTATQSSVGSYTQVGPYAYIRPQSKIGQHVKIGDFVEVKKSDIGDGTKISHLTYVGDSVVGKNVNFGCGTITVNYDGKNKYQTKVEDNAFIGCNTNLISPVTIGEGAFIAAGSTITDDVPSKALAIARQKQVIKDRWAEKRSEKIK